jgi:hypothetical protein
MRFRTMLSLASMFLLCFTVAVWSQPLPPPSSAKNAHRPPEGQTVAGKISSVGDASFAVEVATNQSVNTVQFLVDENTKVEGQLSVGAQASVEYKSDDGRNIATHVVVTETASRNTY